MFSKNRPLSPHLQIYRPQLTSLMSILHRLTGAGLALGAALAAWWLATLAFNVGPGQNIDGSFFFKFVRSPLGQAMLLCWLWAYVYHFLSGLRHLFWDAGYGFDIKTVYRSGWFVLWGSVFLAIAIWGLS